MTDYDDHAATTLREVLARDATRRITRRVIRTLQGLRDDHLQAGFDSGLRDVWDEICVQAQEEESPMWQTYLNLVEVTATRHLDGVPPTQLHAMWVESKEGQWWLTMEYDDLPESEKGELIYLLDDVAEYLRDQVINVACDWSNARISRYLERRW